jgi:virginiamycin B lyase
VTTETIHYRGEAIQFPWGLATAGDGALWFTNTLPPFSIGRISVDGTADVFTDHGIDHPRAIVAGESDDLWFTNTGGNSIGRVTYGGRFTTISDRQIHAPAEIAVAPDGTIWFTNSGSRSLGRIDDTGRCTSIRVPMRRPFGIAVGPDDALWFTDHGSARIGRSDLNGNIEVFSLGIEGFPRSITAGSDNALWFTSVGAIGRLSVDGALTLYRDAGIAGPFGIQLGPDGAVWYADHWNSMVGRVSEAGEITTFETGAGRSEEGTTTDVAPGADGRLWFTDWANNFVGAMHVEQLGEAR